MSDYDHLDSLQLIKILELRDKKFAALEKRFKNFAEQVNNVLAQINIENKARIAELEAENDRLADDCVRMSEPITRNGRLVADIERIAELEEERDQWQESSGQNYVRATEAEMLCDRADEIMARYRHEAEVDRLRIAQLEAGLYRIRDFNNEAPGPAMQDIARNALKESDE
jgi:hypothetical protein